MFVDLSEQVSLNFPLDQEFQELEVVTHLPVSVRKSVDCTDMQNNMGWFSGYDFHKFELYSCIGSTTIKKYLNISVSTT